MQAIPRPRLLVLRISADIAIAICYSPNDVFYLDFNSVFIINVISSSTSFSISIWSL